MQKTSRFLYWLLPLFILVGLSVAFYGHFGDVWRSVAGRLHTWVPSQSAVPPVETPAAGGEENRTAQAPARHPVPVPVPAPATAPPAVSEPAPVQSGEALPPSPPLPQIPPETGQKERQAAFGLFKSIDYIVLRDEPFEVAGRQWTVRQMQSDLMGLKDFQSLVPLIQEKEIGSSIRKPVHPSPSRASHLVYYGIRIVRPHESLWNIHYGILREYLGRRQIDIPADADRPLSDGRSSGVGRVLKFFEGIVSLYDLNDVRAEQDLNQIRPPLHDRFFQDIGTLFGPRPVEGRRYQSPPLHRRCAAIGAPRAGARPSGPQIAPRSSEGQ